LKATAMSVKRSAAQRLLLFDYIKEFFIMTWEIALGIFALVSFVLGIVTPLLKLNSSITKLNCSIDNLNGNMNMSQKRLDIHGKEIDELKERAAKAETDIKAVKQRITDLHNH
jgi:hypothetical protein